MLDIGLASAALKQRPLLRGLDHALGFAPSAWENQNQEDIIVLDFLLEIAKGLPHPFHLEYVFAWVCGLSALAAVWLVFEIYKVKGDPRQDALRWVGVFACCLVGPTVAFSYDAGEIVFAIWLVPILPAFLFWIGIKQTRLTSIIVGAIFLFMIAGSSGEMIRKRVKIEKADSVSTNGADAGDKQVAKQAQNSAGQKMEIINRRSPTKAKDKKR